MGSASSKAARGAGQAARKYPTRAPPAAVSRAPPRSSAKPTTATDQEAAMPEPSSDHDAITPTFSSRLHQMGIADPNPTFSPSSTAEVTPSSQAQSFSQQPSQPLYASPPSARPANSTLSVLDNRARLEEAARREFEELGVRGREMRRKMVDVRTVAEAVRMREMGASAVEVEERLGLAEGVVAKMGEGVVKSVRMGDEREA